MNGRLRPWRLACSLALLLSTARAAAEPTRTDGVYDRFDGDLTLAGGVGVEAGHETAAAARLSAHYFWMFGAYASYRTALEEDAETHRAVSLGVDLRPAFIPRFSEDLEQGPGLLDLSLDSLSLALGAFWAQPASGRLGPSRGLEGSLGLGLPLLGRANGPWLEVRGQLRWPEAASAPSRLAESTVLVLVSYHQLVTALAPDGG